MSLLATYYPICHARFPHLMEYNRRVSSIMQSSTAVSAWWQTRTTTAILLLSLSLAFRAASYSVPPVPLPCLTPPPVPRARGTFYIVAHSFFQPFRFLSFSLLSSNYCPLQKRQSLITASVVINLIHFLSVQVSAVIVRPKDSCR